MHYQPPVYSPLPLKALVDALRSLGHGLEAASSCLADLYAAEEVLLCGSGTQALQIAIEIAQSRVGAPCTVAAPAYSCVDVASAIIGAKARVRLYDIDPMSLSPDLDSLKRVLDEGARVVVVAPLYGYPVDYDAVLACAHDFGALVIEDAAQGHAASWRGRRLGTIGHIATLSFGRGKGWTGGYGGAILLHDRSDNAPSQLAVPGAGSELKALVAAIASSLFSHPAIYGLPRSVPFLQLGRTVYHPPRLPSRMTRVAAALLIRTSEASTVEAQRRRHNAEWYRSEFDGVRSVYLPRAPRQGNPSYLRFPVLLANDAQRLASRPEAVRLGIAPGYPTALNGLAELRRKLGPSQPVCSGADELARRLITLPAHSLLTALDRRRVKEWVAGQAPLHRLSVARMMEADSAQETGC